VISVVKGYRLVLLQNPPEKARSRVLISGFPGFGAVGFLTIKFLVDKLKMRRIGFIEPPIVPDLTSLEDYGLSLPHEIFIDSSGQIIALLNRVNPIRAKMNSFVRSFVDSVRTLDIDEVVLVGGLDARFREGSEEYRWLATSSSRRKLSAPLFVKGPFIVGPLASILITCELEGIPAIAIFPYTEPESLDHRAAAIAIKVISSIIGIEIDVSELLSYAEMVEKMEESLKQVYKSVSEGESKLYM